MTEIQPIEQEVRQLAIELRNAINIANEDRPRYRRAQDAVSLFMERQMQILDAEELANTQKIQNYAQQLVGTPSETLHLIIPVMEKPDMPIHDSISDEDDKFIQRAVDFFDWLSDNYKMVNRDSNDYVVGDKMRRKILFEYLEIDYDDWMKEKDMLFAQIQDAARKAQTNES